VAEDDLPPPAYRPQAPAPAQPMAAAARPRAPGVDESAAGFVAPRPRPAGTPSPEALARLQAAVSRNPGRAAAPAPAPASEAPRAAERPRFGIGSLINRMAGHAAEPAPDRNAARSQPPVTSYDDDADLTPEQQRIEIPAFLRRQAN
jgi:cell division protein FtsZ